MLLATIVVMGSGAVAQTVAPAAPTGTVAGTILFSDTQRPARFAKVTLTPVKNDGNAGLEALSKKKDDNVNLGQAMGALMGGVTMLSAQTDAAGKYELKNVAPGDYYVLAIVPGYVSPGAGSAMSGDVSLEGAPEVHVVADSTVRGDVSLERGAALSGRVTYDDGSPVTGVAVQVESTKKPAKKPDPADINISRAMMMAMSGGLKIAMTDDRGMYRIAGLPAGEYRVKADVQLTGNTSMRGGVISLNGLRGTSKMTVFAPATLHEADAQKMTLKAGDDRTDVDVQINLAGTHTVSGHVASAVDHHLLNSGSVTLVDGTDKKVTRNGAVEPDGSFSIGYVPSGSYTLTISDAADTVAAPSKRATGLINFQQDKTVKSYDDTSLTEVVAAQDVTGINVELKESAKVKQAPDLNGIFGAAGGVSQ
jgi:hypothetical protein